MIHFNKIAALTVQGAQKTFPRIEQNKAASLLMALLSPVDIHKEGILRVAGNRKVVSDQKPLIDDIVRMLTRFIEHPEEVIEEDAVSSLVDTLNALFDRDEGDRVNNRILIIKAVVSNLAPKLTTPAPEVRSKRKIADSEPDLDPARLARLSDGQRFILYTLVQFLRYVASASDVNLMTTQNLAKIFAGTLQGPGPALAIADSKIVRKDAMRQSVKHAEAALALASKLEVQLLHLITKGDSSFDNFPEFNFEREHGAVEARKTEREYGAFPRPLQFVPGKTTTQAHYTDGSKKTWL